MDTAKQRNLLSSLMRYRLPLPKNMSKKQRDELRQFMIQLVSTENKRAITSVKRYSTEIQNSLSRFEQARKVNLDILTPVTLYICKNCHNVVSKNRFHQRSCKCEAKITTVSDIRREPIAYFDAKLRTFISQNYWFEYGIDYILRRKNLQTLCGFHVLGHSGNMHEIDNIAESKSSNFRFFCECKTGEVRASDVFVLAGKMSDIGCSRGYIFTLTKETPKEVVYLARSRNISIVAGVLEKTEADLLQEIRED